MIQNFSIINYQTIDLNNQLTVEYNKVTSTYSGVYDIYRDFGVDGISKYFTITGNLWFADSGATDIMYFATMTNYPGRIVNNQIQGRNFMGLHFTNSTIALRFPTGITQAITLNPSTDYYFKFYNNKANKIYLDVYSDEGMTTLVGSKSTAISVANQINYRYFYPLGSYYAVSVGESQISYIKNVSFVEDVTLDDNKDTTKADRRILGERFVLCAICDRPIREGEATIQRGLKVCKDDVDVQDHEGEL